MKFNTEALLINAWALALCFTLLFWAMKVEHTEARHDERISREIDALSRCADSLRVKSRQANATIKRLDSLVNLRNKNILETTKKSK